MSSGSAAYLTAKFIRGITEHYGPGTISASCLTLFAHMLDCYRPLLRDALVVPNPVTKAEFLVHVLSSAMLCEMLHGGDAKDIREEFQGSSGVLADDPETAFFTAPNSDGMPAFKVYARLAAVAGISRCLGVPDNVPNYIVPIKDSDVPGPPELLAVPNECRAVLGRDDASNAPHYLKDWLSSMDGAFELGDVAEMNVSDALPVFDDSALQRVMLDREALTLTDEWLSFVACVCRQLNPFLEQYNGGKRDGFDPVHLLPFPTELGMFVRPLSKSDLPVAPVMFDASQSELYAFLRIEPHEGEGVVGPTSPFGLSARFLLSDALLHAEACHKFGFVCNPSLNVCVHDMLAMLPLRTINVELLPALVARLIAAIMFYLTYRLVIFETVVRDSPSSPFAQRKLMFDPMGLFWSPIYGLGVPASLDYAGAKTWRMVDDAVGMAAAAVMTMQFYSKDTLPWWRTKTSMGTMSASKLSHSSKLVDGTGLEKAYTDSAEAYEVRKIFGGCPYAPVGRRIPLEETIAELGDGHPLSAFDTEDMTIFEAICKLHASTSAYDIHKAIATTYKLLLCPLAAEYMRTLYGIENWEDLAAAVAAVSTPTLCAEEVSIKL